MILSELWREYEADKRIQGFSPNTLKAYALQLKMLVTLADRGELEANVYPHRFRHTNACQLHDNGAPGS